MVADTKLTDRSPPVSIVTSLTALARCLRQSNAGNNMRVPVFCSLKAAGGLEHLSAQVGAARAAKAAPEPS